MKTENEMKKSLPPHLQILVEKMEKAGWNPTTKIIDRTPKGYGPDLKITD